jgi:hypothetical protein
MIISPADRDFFAQVARAAFVNPFSETRDTLDQLMAGSSGSGSKEDILATVIARVAERATALQRTPGNTLQRLPAADRETVRTVFLFDLYHRHLEDFDRLIQTQSAAGDAPCAVPFARELLAGFSRAGFSEAESLQYLGLFFQVRRAYYFIHAGLTGSGPAMRKVREHLWQTLFTHNTRWFEQYLWNRMEDFSVLLLGETGTGKGAAAAAIGRSGFIPFDPRSGRFSESFTRNFLAVNLSQFAAGTLESELFGHKRGAFTGAIENHDGVFSRCTPHGAIFLDEIGEVALPVQVKLLQVLQERTFSPVGSHQRLRFSGRVIAATNRNLAALRLQGDFRDDFYFRLCSDVITIPPLHQRLKESPAEIGELIGGILLRLAGTASGKEVQVLRKAIERDVGKEYPWPGNVRELEQAVRRVLVTGHYRGESRPALDEKQDRFISAIAAGELDAGGLLGGYCRMLHQRHGTYEEVARLTRLDRRTVKKHIEQT